VGERLWQRAFFDRVIRNRKELNQIRSYISSNPLRWGEGDLLRR
jgi:REP element-mobilizing transposase RayT